MNQPTLSFLNHDNSDGLICPNCGYQPEEHITINSKEFIGIFPVTIIVYDRDKALAYECSKCFEISWFHASPD